MAVVIVRVRAQWVCPICGWATETPRLYRGAIEVRCGGESACNGVVLRCNGVLVVQGQWMVSMQRGDDREVWLTPR